MTQITVDDCLRVVQDRFELVLLCGKRAREIAMTVGERHDKDDVAALQEIGSGYLDINDLRQRLLYAIHDIPFMSKEESEELGDLEMYVTDLAGYEAAPADFYNAELEDTEENKLRVDDHSSS
ncbi:MAG: DNA-directed RNA polymerase subunit omega [Alphaproteobacteria bacterium]|nr:MAG: DNA-directed RNA polymerase subunit omega [Alphaproteobacteria bacterium]